MVGNGRVFVSHAHADIAFCDWLYAWLRYWGIECWYDRGNVGQSSSLSSEIRQAIRGHDIFLRICTAPLQHSFYATLERDTFLSLMEEDSRYGRAGVHRLVNLLVDPNYATDPIRYPVEFIDARGVASQLWLEQLHQALRPPTRSSGYAAAGMLSAPSDSQTEPSTQTTTPAVPEFPVAVPPSTYAHPAAAASAASFGVPAAAPSPSESGVQDAPAQDKERLLPQMGPIPDFLVGGDEKEDEVAGPGSSWVDDAPLAQSGWFPSSPTLDTTDPLEDLYRRDAGAPMPGSGVRMRAYSGGPSVSGLDDARDGWNRRDVRRANGPEHLSFTAYYPREVPAESWQTLLVYTHLDSVVAAVHADAAHFAPELGKRPRTPTAPAGQHLARGTTLTIVPRCAGVRLNPERISFSWEEDLHRADFRFRPVVELTGAAASGEITIFAGPLIVAILKFALLVDERTTDVSSLAMPSTETKQETALPRAVFASYSHDDTRVVTACRNAYRALGLTVNLDIDSLRSGDYWGSRLMELIDGSDLFQLFWSAHAARSAAVREEWRYALARSQQRGPGFIRPVYWEQPLIPPPPELATLHFAYIELPALDAQGH